MKKLGKILAAVVLAAVIMVFAIPVQAATGDELFHFSFEDENNLGLDSAGNGTLSEESYTDDLETTDGMVGNAAAFDGFSSALYINSELNDVKDFTLTYWINVHEYSADFISVIAGDDWSSENNVLHSNITPNYGIEIGASNVEWGGEREFADCIDLDTWYFIAYSVSLTEGKSVFYIDGEKVYEIECSGDIGVDFSKFTIGAWRNGGAFCRYLNGDLDELVLYEGVLTEEQIKAKYDEVNAAATPTPEKTPTPEPEETPEQTERSTQNTDAVQTTTSGAAATDGQTDIQGSDNSIWIIVIIVVVIIACCVGTFIILKKKK